MNSTTLLWNLWDGKTKYFINKTWGWASGISRGARWSYNFEDKYFQDSKKIVNSSKFYIPESKSPSSMHSVCDIFGDIRWQQGFVPQIFV